MKNFEKLSVIELNSNELQETDGGVILWLVAGIVIGFLGAFYWDRLEEFV